MSESNQKKRTFRAHTASVIEHVLRYLKSEYVDGDTEAKKTIICEQVEPAERIATQDSIHYVMNRFMKFQAEELDERDAFLTVHRDELAPKKRTPENGAAETNEGKPGKRKRGKKSTPPSGGEQA